MKGGKVRGPKQGKGVKGQGLEGGVKGVKGQGPEEGGGGGEGSGA